MTHKMVPVAYAVTANGEFVNGNIFTFRSLAVDCKLRLDKHYPGDKREVVELFSAAAPAEQCAHEWIDAGDDMRCEHCGDIKAPAAAQEPTEEWHRKIDAVLEQQRGGYKHPDCVAEGCMNKIHHGVTCRGMCENLEGF